nr:hypothetical protein [Eubacterium sp.]
MKCKKLVVAFVLLLVSVFAPLYSVRAESGINGYEAWIVSVINGTFEYEGRYYRAKDEYIAQATAYLNRDDIDLNEKQAAKAVNYIYSHIADGIASGYIYEISDSTDDTGETTEDSTEDSTEDKDKTTEKSTEDKDKTTEKTTEDKDKTTEKSTDDKDKTTEKSTDYKDKTTEKSSDNTGKENSTESTNDPGNTSEGDNGEGTTSESKYGVDLPTDENGAIIIDYSDLDKTAYDDILSEIRLDELEKSDKINVKDIDDRPEKEDAET